MGKKAEKSLSRDRHSAVTLEETEKSTEPYKCNGNFLMDFTELCKQTKMAYVPSVMTRPKLPSLQQTVSDVRLDKKGDKKQHVAAPEPESEVEVTEVAVEGPPKTYTTKDKFQFFKPSVQVELDSSDKWDTVTEVYVRGWKIEPPMMEVFRRCWIQLSKLHTINLWNTGLTEETLHFLATFLPQCPNIRNVLLDGNSVKEENWSDLLVENSLIQNLSLRFCNITDKGAAVLGRALKAATSTSTKLLSLNLAGNLIGDDGAECLAESLRINRTLLSLILTSNKIGDRGAVKFSEALSRIALTHEEVVMRRMLLSERESIDVKSPVPHKRPETRDRPVSVSKSVSVPDKSKQKPGPKKKADSKLKDSKEDIRSPKKEKEDPKAKKEPRGGRGAPGNPGGTSGRISSDSVTLRAAIKLVVNASSATDASKPSVKSKDKKKDRVKPSSNDADNTDSHDQVSPLLDPAEFYLGQLWITGNRSIINLNLARNQIGEAGMSALLKAIQFQAALKLENKSNQTGLLRLVVNKNAVAPDSESVAALNELMLVRDPFYKPPVGSETSTTA